MRVEKILMCTRYYMEMSPLLRPYIEAANRSELKDRLSLKLGRPMVTQGEVKPGDIAPVIATSRKGTVSAFPMAFGFTSATGSLILNVRMETAAQKPMFAQAWSLRRCIIPASWYFEWQHQVRSDGRKTTGDKYLFQPEGMKAAWICGLYRFEDNLPCFVIITREAVPDIQRIHNRMPLIMPDSAVFKWIHPSEDPAALAGLAVNDLFFDKVG